MMSLLLRLELIIFTIIFSLIILWIVKKEKLLMKYALLWLISVFLMIIAVAIPNFIEKISLFLGFKAASNMIFFLGFIFLIYISLTLTIIVSKQSNRIKLLIQEVSILKKGNGKK